MKGAGRFNQDEETGTMTETQTHAPDTLVNLADETRRHLSTFWQEGRLVLVFLRHLG